MGARDYPGHWWVYKDHMGYVKVVGLIQSAQIIATGVPLVSSLSHGRTCGYFAKFHRIRVPTDGFRLHYWSLFEFPAFLEQ